MDIPETADVTCFGRVDGTGELHADGSYLSIVAITKSGERRVHRVSLGVAEGLVAQIEASLPKHARSDEWVSGFLACAYLNAGRYPDYAKLRDEFLRLREPPHA